MTREQLLACLTETAEHGVAWDGDRYADWSTRSDGGYRLEVGDGDEAVQMELTRAELADLHRQLTLTLLGETST